MSANTGGPAFPCEIPLGVQAKTHGVPAFVTGLSIRDYFAAKALAAIITETSNVPIEGDAKLRCQVIARFAYMHADAMILERSK